VFDSKIVTSKSDLMEADGGEMEPFYFSLTIKVAEAV
jgi:hypothetical protein